MSKKKYLTAALFSALTLTACGGGTSTNQDSDAAQNGGQGNSTEVEIVWRGSGEGDPVADFLNEFEPAFEEENPDIDLVLTPITGGEGDYFTKLNLSMQSPETAPDIVSQDSYVLNSDANAGYLKNLDENVTAWDEWSQFLDPAIDSVTAEDGSVYAIPATLDTRGLWYNKDVFKAAGLPEDWQPESWEDIYGAIDAIQASGSDAVPFSMNVAQVNSKPTTLQTFMMLLYSTGETLYDDETQKWNVNGQGIVDSFTFIDEIMNQRKAGPSLSTALNTNYVPAVMHEMLPNDQVGIVLDGIWHARKYVEGGVAETPNPEEKYGFVALPTQNGEEPGHVTMTGTWAWSIPENSQNQEEAWRVIQAMSSTEWQLNRVNKEGTLTVREDAAEDSTYKERFMIEEGQQALDNAHFRPKNDLYPNVSVEVASAVEAVATGELTPEQAAEQYRNAVIQLAGEENVQ
ncbi:extracellular solute-binding protein [Atopococcus tabaci]|uniref:extracellular solute-binding protein n=1 Tax=Atopococcus tabaci TaxID=269774 RepID=UPI002409CF97|nr:extracellular solute-binding protein [Atopococcus tabaci]